MDFRDELYFLVLTVEQEAGGEDFIGQLAVAFVIMNRAKASKKSVMDTVFRYRHFSCWNDDSPTRMSLDTFQEDIFQQCYKAACAAYFDLLQDPTHGANHYLNEIVTRRMRGGALPDWFDANKITAKIGGHTFLKL